jgi:pyruvate dehydrogenase E1 component alpha subunit
VSIAKEALLHAYRTMKTIREFEERVNAEIMNGQIPGFTHLYTGQEANAVGVCAHLDESDTIISTHRGHGHCIAKGADVSGMMKELFGSSEGLCKGKGGSMHVADIDKGILGAKRHCRRGSTDFSRLSTGREDSQKRQSRCVVFGRWLGQSGHVL